MKKCKYCKTHDTVYTDWMFHNAERTYKLKGDYVSKYDVINIDVVIDTENGTIGAVGTVFGLDISSKDIKIKYCPFCGSKLEIDNEQTRNK